MRTVTALSRAAHLAPTVVVTILAALLAVAAGHQAGGTVLIAAAVASGQLVIGWSNDLLDEERDHAVGRTDKPLVTGEVSRRTLGGALVVAALVCTGLSVVLGPAAGLAHLVLVASGVAYNAGVKATVWSWVPYALAFGALPAVPWLALRPPAWPPVWMLAVGVLLGVGAHLVNVLPDLADDAATGVRGAGHRLGARTAGAVAVAIFMIGTAMSVLGPGPPVPVWGWVALVAAGVAGAAAVIAGGRRPFHAAMAIAILNVVMLLARTP
ncbi:MAG TPA: UbiA family prenyltransferase [Beutenbergiaceae bacterium]|nr:UbiA family prenyltransferase [Beutenbergiaceae bacterium]